MGLIPLPPPPPANKKKRLQKKNLLPRGGTSSKWTNADPWVPCESPLKICFTHGKAQFYSDALHFVLSQFSKYVFYVALMGD